MKSLLMISILIGLILLSGCTGPGGGGAPSVKISNFGPLTIGATQDVPVRNGKTLTLSATFKNEGSAEADGKARIVGLGNEWNFITLREQPFKIGIGKEVRKTWKITTPQTTGSGIKISLTYPVEVRYEYKYGTALRSSFSWISEKHYEEILESGDEQLRQETLKNKGISVQQSSIGPVDIELKLNTYIEDPEVTLTIVNKGNGYLQNNRLTITTYTGLTCDEISGNTIELYQNKFETVCKVVKSTNDEIATDITVSINYDYYTNSESKIYYEDIGK